MLLFSTTAVYQCVSEVSEHVCTAAVPDLNHRYDHKVDKRLLGLCSWETNLVKTIFRCHFKAKYVFKKSTYESFKTSEETNFLKYFFFHLGIFCKYI